MTDKAPDDKPRAAVAWTSTVIAIAAGLLLLTNAASLKGWLDQHPPDAAPAAARSAVEAWWDLTAGAGLTTPRATVERLWRAAQALAWPAAPATPGQAPRR